MAGVPLDSKNTGTWVENALRLCILSLSVSSFQLYFLQMENIFFRICSVDMDASLFIYFGPYISNLTIREGLHILPFSTMKSGIGWFRYIVYMYTPVTVAIALWLAKITWLELGEEQLGRQNCFFYTLMRTLYLLCFQPSRF